jgi:hypothetical protein
LRNVERPVVEDVLPRHTGGVGEHRPHRFVPIDDVQESRPQPDQIERTVQPDRDDRVVLRIAGRPLVEEPQPSL